MVDKAAFYHNGSCCASTSNRTHSARGLDSRYASPPVPRAAAARTSSPSWASCRPMDSTSSAAALQLRRLKPFYQVVVRFLTLFRGLERIVSEHGQNTH